MIRLPYGYHKFWKGLNRDIKDSRRRWDDNYVVAKEWYEYFIGFSPIPIMIAPVGPMYLLLQLPHEMLNDKSGVGVAILLISLGTWYVMGIWKLLPSILKKYGIIVYAPKGVPLK